jgi:hypothetical protein
MRNFRLLPLVLAVSSGSTQIYANDSDACVIGSAYQSEQVNRLTTIESADKIVLQTLMNEGGYGDYLTDDRFDVQPIIINPVLGTLMSDGQIMQPPYIRLELIKHYIERKHLTNNTFFSEGAHSAIKNQKSIEKFEYLAMNYWSKWFDDHKSSDASYQAKSTHPILEAEGLIKIKNCRDKLVYAEESVGYATLSVFARYALSQGLDPETLSIKELYAIGNGYESGLKVDQRNTNGDVVSGVHEVAGSFGDVDKSLYTQAALFFAHKRGLINLYSMLSVTDVQMAIKLYRRHYQAAIMHTEAMRLYQEAHNLKPIPTIENVAKEVLRDAGLDPLMRVGIEVGFLEECSNAFDEASCTDELWKFYARSESWTGKYNVLIKPDFSYSSMANSDDAASQYARLPELKDVLQRAMDSFKTSIEYEKYKKATALLIRSQIAVNSNYSDEAVALVLDDSKAHNLKMAYYGVSDQALMYFDTVNQQ